jgi:hypothetical protein
MEAQKTASYTKEDMVTIVLVLIIIFLLWRMCKNESFIAGYDAGNDMTSCGVNDYDIVDRRPATGMTHYYGNLGSALPGYSARSDWMSNRFTTSARDNFIAGGFCGDSVTNDGGIIAGPVFAKNDPRDFVGQAKSSLSQTPINSTQELTDLIQYG